MEEKRIYGKTLQEWINERLDDETVLVETIGDGLQLVYLYMIATPSYRWLFKIDSEQELNAEYATKLLEIIDTKYGVYPEHGVVDEEEFNKAKVAGDSWAVSYEDFEEYDYFCTFPVANSDCGFGWDEIVNFGKD